MDYEWIMNGLIKKCELAIWKVIQWEFNTNSEKNLISSSLQKAFRQTTKDLSWSKCSSLVVGLVA